MQMCKCGEVRPDRQNRAKSGQDLLPESWTDKRLSRFKSKIKLNGWICRCSLIFSSCPYHSYHRCQIRTIYTVWFSFQWTEENRVKLLHEFQRNTMQYQTIHWITLCKWSWGRNDMGNCWKSKSICIFSHLILFWIWTLRSSCPSSCITGQFVLAVHWWMCSVLMAWFLRAKLIWKSTKWTPSPSPESRWVPN